MTVDASVPTLDLLRVVRSGYLPPPELTVSEFSDQEIIVTSGPLAGTHWQTAFAPYQRGILDAFHEKGVEIVVVMGSSQWGKTSIAVNIVAYHIAHDPCTILIVEPTVDPMAKDFAKNRLDPVISASPILQAAVSKKRAKDASNTTLQKTFRGGSLAVGGANSAASLAARSVRLLVLDEIDRYPAELPGEGSTLAVAMKRTTAYRRRRRILMVSSPTLKGGPIHSWHGRGDQRRFYVPCPACSVMHPFEWQQVRWVDEDPATACLHCPACDHGISEAERVAILADGEWRSEKPERAEASIVSFHMWEAYSPLSSLEEIVKGFLRARALQKTGDRSEMHTWQNTTLGEPVDPDIGEGVEPHSLLLRREAFDASVPVALGACCLTMGVDVQDDRLEVLILGWGPGEESWLVDRHTLPGDTSQPEPWRMLDELLETPYRHESGQQLMIHSTCIDSGGHRTTIVYDYAARKAARRVYAIIGRDGQRPIVSSPSPRRWGRQERQVPLYTVGVDAAKALFISRLSLTEKGPGYVHIPHAEWADEELAAQLTSERLVMRWHKGVPQQVWKKIRPRNEMLDCFDSQTEVLTASGWKCFQRLTKQDQVATVNLETDTIEYQAPTHLIANRYAGQMLHMSGKRIDLLVTPNHRMVTHRKRQVTVDGIRRWRFDDPAAITLAKDLTVHHTLKATAEWVGDPADAVTVGNETVNAGDFAEFLGWYVAEGSRWTGRSKTQGNLRHRVCVSQKPGQKQRRLLELCDRLPWRFRVSSGRDIVCSRKELFDYLSCCGDGVEHKRVPQWVKDADGKVIARFLEGAILGDGWSQRRKTTHRIYATVSRQLADDIQELFIKSGRMSNIAIRPPSTWNIRGRSGQTRPQFWVSECKARRISLDGGADGQRGFIGRWTDYDGMVYCATVPNGTLIVRRNGKSAIAGNCAVYSIAALRLLNPKLAVMAASLAMKAAEPVKPLDAQPAKPPAPRPRTGRSNYLTR